MNRERLAWIASTVIIAALALRLPGATAQREADFQFTSTLSEIHRWVDTSYVEKTDDAKLQEAAITGMLSSLDPYTVYVPPAHHTDFEELIEGRLAGIGVTLHRTDAGQYEIASPMDNSPAAKAGVLAGDVILEVDHRPITGKNFEELGIKGTPGTKVTLTLQRDGKPLEVTVERAGFQIPTITGYDRNADQSWNYFPIPGERIGYLRVSQFTDDTAKDFERAVQQMDPAKLTGLVIDLRDNGGGLVDSATTMADLFLPANTPIVTTRDRKGTPNARLATTGMKFPDFPVVILVNGNTASASEIFAGALSDDRRATLVGTRTFGKGSVQEIHEFPNNGGTLKITVAHYYLPSGRMIHRLPDSKVWGVDPQVLVPVSEPVDRSAATARIARENWRRPGQKGPATRATDPQLDEALKTVLALNVMSAKR